MNDLLHELRNGELHITLNSPETGNGASDAVAAELARLLRSAEERAHVVVLRGAGDDFCVGRKANRGGPPPVDALDRRRGSDIIFDCYQSFRDCNVPVIGVIQGKALGFGASMAALCDITIAADTATFQIPEMNHNILPTMVMSAMIDRVPRKNLVYLVLARDTIDAMRAREMCIVSEVVPAVKLEAVVADLLARFATTPKVALAGTKEYTRAGYEMSTRGAVDFARNLHATINSATEMMRHK